ncbi:hypothetical protein CspHIS471_0309220 [Cutaneotrichosporon sp. HIS471]|nr:hypothetical protein CspHIS471_0309220 [Cutaneotrichosporon sp. HIS471]
MSDPHHRLDTGVAASRGPSPVSNFSSAPPNPSSNLTTFPNPFQDEPETGLLPSLLSKVKSTFSSAPPKEAKEAAAPAQPPQSAAQQIVEATRKQHAAQAQAQAAATAQAQAAQAVATPSTMTSHTSAVSVPSVATRRGTSQLSIGPSGDTSPSSAVSPTAPSLIVAALPLPTRAQHSHQNSTASASNLSSAAASVASSQPQPQPRRHLIPGEANWRPAAASAQVTVSPVTSVTTTAPRMGEDGMPPPRLMSVTPTMEITNAKGKPVSGSAMLGGGRLRRGSIGTIPDSPSSVSLSAMISGNAELSQNHSYSFVPGFQLPAEDTRSIRSLAIAKRPHSVSKIIRRMRGEGLSKHYWMADENCKECYDCKSVFTTWRRKHHCRICGQIFCGRCASNIIGARRFGQDGMVRVCNLCLKIMEDYDDDDDRRSINSTMSGLAGLPDRVISPEITYSQSPFAASQLFRSTNDSLSAIEESVHQPYRDDDSDGSDTDENTGSKWGLWPSIAAPFRRHRDDNSDDHGQESNTHSELASEAPSPRPGSAGGDNSKPDFPLDRRPRVGFPRTETIESEEGMPIINAPLNLQGLRTRLSSAASLRVGANNGLSALLDTDRKDGLWRARSYSFVTPPEFLTGPSLAHFNTMLQQSIERHELPNPETWHRVLSKLLLRVSTNLRPVVRAGDSIDVRTYVKIKKVPGGKITDSEYVDGIVITKNVAHKGMSRRLVNPRIMVITFPLDYHRVETQFMSLDPILKQENDYLRLLTNRIIDLRPHIVLVERFVSRIALDFLYKANIVVARGVKFSAIHQVARCTHADIIGSMDKLALEPRLGRCADFKVQTFEHELIPGKRKTYMRFEGTHNGFGGTIILRGGTLSTLKRAKLIADFLALVAYHLKNETFLYGDEFQMLPPRPPMPEEYRDLLRLLADKRATPKAVYGRDASSPPTASPISPDSELTPRAEREPSDPKEIERANALQVTREIAESLEPYLTTVLSASVAVRFPPPHTLAKMAALDRKLNFLRLKKDEREAAKILEEEKRPEPPKLELVKMEPIKIVVETEEDLARKEAEKKDTEKKDPEKNEADKAIDTDKEDADQSSETKGADQAKSVSPENEAETPKAPEKTPPKEEDGKESDKPEQPVAVKPETEVVDDAMSIKSAPLPMIDVGSATSSAANSAFTSPVAVPTATLPSSISLPVLPPPTPSPTPVPALTPLALTPTPVPSAVVGGKGGDPYRILLNPEDFVEASTLAFVEYDHEEQYKLFKHYVRRNNGPLHPKNFQGIIYLQALYRQGQDKPCVEPARQEINFYQEDDQTLGQFLGSMVANAVHRCPNPACEILMLFHYDVLVHAERRLQIAMEHFSCPLPGHEEQILTWSYCRQCNRSWEPTVIREETWRMSWGAYLEHCFYPPETRTGFGCAHDAYREHIRYFAHHNMVVRIHNDEIELYEPVRPPIKVIWNVEDKVALKNAEYESALAKTAAFFDSVMHRLRSFTDDLVEPDKQARMRADRDALLTRAVADRDETVNSLKLTYKQTPPTDVLAINVVLQALQDRVIQWDLDFLDVEKLYMPSEKDLKRMTATHLKRLFATHDVFGSLDKNVAGIAVPEVDEHEKMTDPESSKPPSIAPTLELDSRAATPPIPESEASGPSPEKVVEKPEANILGDKPTQTNDKAEKPEDKVTSSVTASSDTATPTQTMSRATAPSLLAPPKTPELETRNTPRGYETDSTISAAPRPISVAAQPYTPSADLASSGVDSDTHAFVSRLPVRRNRPTPSVADLVKRFQDTAPERSGASTPTLERPRSAAGMHRRVRHEPTDVSDSDAGRPHRPFLRRNRATEQTVMQRNSSRSNLFSDGDRSYAVNASRVVSKRQNTDPTFGIRGRLSQAPSPSRSRSRPVSPSARKDGRLAAPPNVAISKSVSMEGKPRLLGKGKTPRKPPLPVAPQASPGGNLMRGIPRRVMGAGSRVTSIARHFDKISREAERDRAKRLSLARGKRAGRVGVTKARVQVFNNVRDAFRDEFDSDSSAADNEEEADGSDVSVDSTGRAKPRRKQSSPAKPRPALLPPHVHVPPTPPPKKARRSDDDTEAEAEATTPKPAAPETRLSEVYAETDDAGGSKIASDRLHIELAPFDTSAPLPSVPPTPAAGLITEDEAAKKGLSQMSQISESEMSSGGGERSSILKTLTGLWAIRAGDFTPLDYPLSAAEHIFVDSRVIVREHEPTSIIAFTLCSKQYREQIRSVAAASKARAARAERAQHSTFPSEPSMLEEVGNERPWDMISVDELDEPSLAGAGTHLKYEFEAGSSTISCRIFFAEQFAALRLACQCEDGFIESLARCAKFDASGGKSGSAFLKTKDNRFIVKEISRYEMDALTKFAPAYFEYTSTAFDRQRPTALAKTYGIFKIGYRNGVTGRSMHMNVLVQENLFYGRHFSKIYDLKGSTRNRLIKPTGRANEVLLDENLMEISHTSPLYLRDHAKLILRTALWNDTLFLSGLNVMDYSLVVGVDAENKELVVGVVDYIRTFTWDKKVESWVKDFGGGGRGEPTIVTPQQYRKRFRTAMERFYFPSVPDRWSQAMADEPLDEESATLLNM